MSRDAQYIHHQWHIEDPSLFTSCPKLDLAEFDPPGAYSHPAWVPATGVQASRPHMGCSSAMDDPLLKEWSMDVLRGSADRSRDADLQELLKLYDE